MENEMIFEISRLRLEIDHLQKYNLSLAGNDMVIFTIPDSVIELLSDLDLPTIHKVLEVILFYSSYTGRSLEIDEVLLTYLDEYVDQEMLIKAIGIVQYRDVVNKLEEELGQIYDLLKGVLFCGWTINKSSINFYENYDILIKSEKYT